MEILANENYENCFMWFGILQYYENKQKFHHHCSVILSQMPFIQAKKERQQYKHKNK